MKIIAMKMRSIHLYMQVFLIACLFPFFSLESLEERQSPHPMRTSIIVPCHTKHFGLIPPLLTYYENQTILPDEVVIALNPIPPGDHAIREAIEVVKNNEYPFLVKIIVDEPGFSGSAGRNRNRACEHSTGDLLICQDADDIPHPQRTEIIKRLFENYHVDFLLHRWIPTGNNFRNYLFDDILALSTYLPRYTDIPFDYIHNGNIAITRAVFNAVRWPEISGIGEDVQFCNRVFEKFKYKVGVNGFLLLYRFELTSFKN